LIEIQDAKGSSILGGLVGKTTRQAHRTCTKSHVWRSCLKELLCRARTTPTVATTSGWGRDVGTARGLIKLDSNVWRAVIAGAQSSGRGLSTAVQYGGVKAAGKVPKDWQAPRLRSIRGEMARGASRTLLARLIPSPCYSCYIARLEPALASTRPLGPDRARDRKITRCKVVCVLNLDTG